MGWVSAPVLAGVQRSARSAPSHIGGFVPGEPAKREHTLLAVYLIGMAVPAWLTVLSGAYIVYPWYRAVPPTGVTDLGDYPRRLLLARGTHPNGTTLAWSGKRMSHGSHRWR